MAQISPYYKGNVFAVALIDKSSYIDYATVGNNEYVRDKFNEFVRCFNLYNSALPKENVNIIGFFSPYPAGIEYRLETELNIVNQKVKKLQQARQQARPQERYKRVHIEVYYDKNYDIKNVLKNIDRIKKMYEKSYSNLNVTFRFYSLDYDNIGSDLSGRQFIDSCGGSHKLPQNIFKLTPLVQKGGE